MAPSSVNAAKCEDFARFSRAPLNLTANNLQAWLLANGADAGAADDRGFTALHRAAEMGKASAVRALLDAGASPTVEAIGHTPISLAEMGGHTEIVEKMRANVK